MKAPFNFGVFVGSACALLVYLLTIGSAVGLITFCVANLVFWLIFEATS